MSLKTDSPVHVKFALNLLTIALIATGLYLGRRILIPFFFSVLLAMLLFPVVQFLIRWKFKNAFAIISAIFLAFIVFGSVIYFLSTQVANFIDDIPKIKQELADLAALGKQWVQQNFNITIREQDKYLDQTAEKMSDDSQFIVQRTFLTLTEAISYIIFLPVFTFLILYHKNLILKFLTTIFKGQEKENAAMVIYEAQSISQSYLAGLLIEVCIVFTLNAAGFLLLGIKYPFFLALLAALLNIVPYIGMLFANIFSALVTLVSNDDPLLAIWVCGVLAAVQVVDNNILMPFIVGSKIKINALAIILGVLVGGSLCGVPGMFLAIPGLALLKIVFERVEALKPWAILLSDESPPPQENANFIKKAVVKNGKKEKNGNG